MAFGKDAQILNNVGSFRQSSRAFNQSRIENKSRTGGSGGKQPSWVNEFKPTTDDVDTIRIIQGAYTVDEVDRHGNLTQVKGLTFWPFSEHYDARSRRRCVCSAGVYANNRAKRAPCHGCDLFWSSMKTDPISGKRAKGFMGRRDMVAFTIIDYASYHKVAQLDAQGQPKMNPTSNQPFYSWVKCRKSSEGRGVCNPCDANAETHQGHRLHWPMGSDHYNTLLEYDETVGKSCMVCSGTGTVRNEAWLCSNLKCGEALIDAQTRLSKKEIDELVNNPVRCKHCQQEGFLTELISCLNCTPAGKIPKRATIFDVDLTLKRIEPADGSNRTSLSIVGFIGPRPIEKQFAEIAKPEELSKIYAPTPMEVQASLFNVSPTIDTVVRDPVTTASRPYGASGPNYG